MKGKVVLITGAKGGLGTFVTKAFLSAGATVAGVSRSIQQKDFDSPNFYAFAAGLSTSDAAKSVVNAVVQKHGRLDVLVHLLGGFAGGQTVAETSDATLDEMVDLNLRSAFFVIKAAVPYLRQSGEGRIIAIGSRAATEPSPRAAIYAASKAALVSLIGSVAAENQDAHFTANVVLPGTLDTPANRSASPDADFSRWTQPGAVADVTAWLASDGARQINGAVIPIYGRDV